MMQFAVQTEIRRAPSDVFAYVTDPAKLATWQTNTVSAQAEGNLPLGVGTRLREVHRIPGGKHVSSLVEVTEYDADRVFALQMLEGKLPIHARITLEPTDAGTLLRFAAHGELLGAMRFARPLLKFTLKRQFASYCTTLKRVLETGPRPD